MNQITIHLNIPAERYLSYYQGAARTVTAKSIDGQVIQFPANRLQPYITTDGIFGTFVIRFDENNKFSAIEKIK